MEGLKDELTRETNDGSLAENVALSEERNTEMRERQVKKKKRKKRMNPFLKMAIAAAFAAAVLLFLGSPLFTVEKFTVEGNSYYLKDEILTMGNCRTGGNIFWGTDCADIKSRLEKDAYMSEVKVKRVLPDTISIELSERRQIGAIVYGEKYVVIDTDGTVLRKTEVDPKVTVLRGLTISRLEVGTAVEVEEKVIFRQILELLRTADRENMYFKKIEAGKASIDAYVLDHLMCEGAPENISAAVSEGRLQITVEELFDRDIERGIIKISGDSNISFTPKID